MNKILIIFSIIMASIVLNAKEVTIEMREDNLYYEINHQKPFTGKMKRYYESGQLEVERNYIDGVYKTLKVYYENGQLRKIETDEAFKSYYENGQISIEGTYEMIVDETYGMLRVVGPWVKRYYKNGQLKSEEAFKNGKRDGLSKWYYANGKLSKEEAYKDDKKEGSYKHYYESGQLREVGTYKNLELEGVYKEYYESGQLSREEIYKNGKEEGPYKTYYKNGQLKREGAYKNGKRDGLYKWYYENGKLAEEDTYKDGESTNFYKIVRSYLRESFLNVKLGEEKSVSLLVASIILGPIMIVVIFIGSIVLLLSNKSFIKNFLFLVGAVTLFAILIVVGISMS